MQQLWPTQQEQPDLVQLYAEPRTPWLRMNFVTSLDGAGTVDGKSAGLSGAADKRVFGTLRMLCDALLVGAGTLRDEGYRALRLDPERRKWRLDHGLSEYPVLAVVSGRADLDPAHPALADAPVRPIVITRGQAAHLSDVADVIDTADDLPATVATLHARGLRSILSEGGPHLFGSLTAAGLVDELCLTVSPLLAGPGAGRITAGPPVPAPQELTLRHALLAEGQLMLRYCR
ncbi:pyrimidine reductase family protein [Dactylosporangium sp. AC04546]|uniref:pyrimidine reductase family protein n=1 Tax=Dactylosporangium sp. AC04546 TaxID=2862460 RepID=UPI001EDFA7D7|nr:pyrimidine reductase family protein [Dactylosporangium sp. AC04546]WVK85465.1 pyrimidine reductase family protein [Dactylosporangium sp. AC04546]